MKCYGLVDAVDRARRFPHTFEIPPEEEVAALRVGDLVKLGFQWPRSGGASRIPPGAERMWVRVTHAGDGFVGTLESTPFDPHAAIQRGATVRFSRAHVFDIDSRHHLRPLTAPRERGNIAGHGAPKAPPGPDSRRG